MDGNTWWRALPYAYNVDDPYQSLVQAELYSNSARNEISPFAWLSQVLSSFQTISALEGAKNSKSN